MHRTYDLTGQHFGKLIAIEPLSERGKHGHIQWLCRCDCGNNKIISSGNLRNGTTRSCGCLMPKAGYKHKYVDTKLYYVWALMKDRCNNPNNKKYSLYGGRGISVCAEWENAKIFCDWAINSGYKEGLTIDRINADGNYEPNNCRWSTYVEQNHHLSISSRNKSGHIGVSWAKDRNKWISQICANSKRIYIGRFDKIEDAIHARKEAEKKYWHTE